MIPFKLLPTYKNYIWGGNKLRPDSPRTAEAWIVFDENIIMDGEFAGFSLNQLINSNGVSLLGSKVVAKTGKTFPLLIKLLDCEQWLSLQVHPNNEQAQQLAGFNHYGKTEAWYIINAEENAQIISGFRPNVTSEEINNCIGRKDILDLVKTINVQANDTVFISPGTIHALGPGLLLYEVQQNSDITYRVYDWDRPMKGNRKLHLEESIQVINPKNKGLIIADDPMIPYLPKKELITCEYFTLSLLHGHQNKLDIASDGTSFSVITALSHQIEINGTDWSFKLSPYETLFLPAKCKRFSVIFHHEAKALYTYC